MVEAAVADSETMEGARSLVDLIEQLHRAAGEAAALGFPAMARHLDECGFELATELADGRRNEYVLVERARKCLDVWRALRDW
jgi:HPt (histidine-containing phosphotransfer) domain-containing protein